jgi:hypothetical protein
VIFLTAVFVMDPGFRAATIFSASLYASASGENRQIAVEIQERDITS